MKLYFQNFYVFFEHVVWLEISMFLAQTSIGVKCRWGMSLCVLSFRTFGNISQD